MSEELRNKIISSNKAANLLINKGYSLQGLTSDLKQIAVLKNEKLHFFSNYNEANINLKH